MPLTLHEDNIVRSIVKDSFFDFLKEFWEIIVAEEPYFNWHIEYLCHELQEVAERVFVGEPKLYDLIINIPPGTTKSTICSQAFPAWVWTRMPSARFIAGSYAQAVAMKDSLKCRDLVQSEKYQRVFPEIQLREDENTKGLFTNTKMGSRLAVGVGGFVTGYHAHFQIVDDPINPEEAFSEAELKTANRWMTQTLSSRKVDKRVTPLILVQQRLAEQDPSGELLERSRKGVKHIKLPGDLEGTVSPAELAANYSPDPTGGAALLDPIRLPREVLEKSKEEMGVYGYAAQILQEPVPLGGGMFLVDKIIQEDDEPSLPKIARSWDKAGTRDGGAYTAGVKIGRDSKGDWWIVDVRRKQWGATEREENILATAEEDGDDVPIILEIEGGSGGKESGENTVRNLAGYKVITYHPTGDKESRAYPFASQVGAGKVHVLKRHWTKAYIEELRHFSEKAKYKDQVDASSGGFNYLARGKKKVGGAW